MSNIPTSVIKETYEGFKKILTFHVPPPAHILDPTCGKRILWRSFTPEELANYNIVWSDTRDFGDNLVGDVKDVQGVYDGIVYDPPYLFGLKRTTDPRSDDYGNYVQSYDDLVRFMTVANEVFPSRLGEKGKLLVKCSDQFNLKERKFYPLHVTWVEKLTNFNLIDLFVSPHHHINGTAWQVKNRPCSVINHTYFLVFCSR